MVVFVWGKRRKKLMEVQNDHENYIYAPYGVGTPLNIFLTFYSKVMMFGEIFKKFGEGGPS
mgnify:CR=1 FL=1